jgi:hypothetical protein
MHNVSSQVFCSLPFSVEFQTAYLVLAILFLKTQHSTLNFLIFLYFENVELQNQLLTYCNYSKVSIIRPGRSRLLEFEKNKLSTGHLIETFSKYSDQVVL